MNVIKPPAPITLLPHHKSIFLAGSIEMGNAEDWQSRLTEAIRQSEVAHMVTVLNPRRDDWDSSWEQSIYNPKFREQVEWELDGLDRADVIALNLLPDTKSPVSLLELGLYANHFRQALFVLCQTGFWRKGNVDIVCKRFRVPVSVDEQMWIQTILEELSG